MATVLQLTKILTARPTIEPLADVALRNFAGPQDISPWLALRDRAFARQKLGVRSWTERDFEVELASRSWWRAERLWLAESVDPARRLLGAVALAERDPDHPAVHWLMVDPIARRQGIGSLLMSALEAACWDAGHRQIWLETHESWHAAARLYRARGYAPAISA